MRFCIADLLKLKTDDERAKLPSYYDTGDTDMDEEDHEAICSMFTTIGLTIDTIHASDFVNLCFAKIAKLSKLETLPSRSRFLYKDLIDLRANKWVPRRKVEKAKTLDEIRKDVEREERKQAQESAQNNYRGGGGGGRGGGGRGGGRNDYRDNRGRGGGGGGDYRQSRNNDNYQPNNRQRSQKQMTQTDDDGFTTIVGGSTKSRPPSSLQAAVGRGPPPPPGAGKRGKGTFQALAEEAPAPSSSSVEPMSKEKFERRVKSMRGEFKENPNDIKELLLSWDELTGTPNYGSTFVQLNGDRIIDSKDDERDAIYKMLSTLVEQKKLSASDVKAGLADLIEFIDSYVYDAPLAFDYLGAMLSSMMAVGAVDVAWICEQAEKTKLAGAENPGKVIKSLAVALEKSNGKDGAKSTLNGSKASLEKLLGADGWAAIASTL